MKKLVKERRILTIIFAIAIVACNSSISAEVVENQNSFEIPVEFSNSGNGYVVTEETEWFEDGKMYSLNKGDVIGVCEDNIQARYVGEITAEHYGGREFEVYSATGYPTGRQRVSARTRAKASINNSDTAFRYVKSYSRATYELFGEIRVDSGRVWGQTYETEYWSEAHTDWRPTSLARDLQARTYWGTE